MLQLREAELAAEKDVAQRSADEEQILHRRYRSTADIEPMRLTRTAAGRHISVHGVNCRSSIPQRDTRIDPPLSKKRTMPCQRRNLRRQLDHGSCSASFSRRRAADPTAEGAACSGARCDYRAHPWEMVADEAAGAIVDFNPNGCGLD
jgi:hypothetical protein